MPHRVVHLHQPRPRVRLPPRVVRFLALRHGQRPRTPVVRYPWQRPLEVHPEYVLHDKAADEDVAAQIINRQVVEQFQVLQPPDDDMIVVSLQYRLRHPAQHAETPFSGGQIPPSLPGLVHRVSPLCDDHQRLRRVVHAARHLGVRVERHAQRVGHRVHTEHSQPRGVIPAVFRRQVVHHPIDDVMLPEGREVMLPAAAHLQRVRPIRFQRHRLDGSRRGERIIPLHGRQAVVDEFQHH